MTAEPVRGQSAPKPKPSGYLGPRARQVLNGMARCLTNQAIGVELGITTDTVKTHGRRIFAVLGVSTRLDAVAAGRRAGLVSVRCPMCGGGASEGRSGASVGELSPEGLPGAPRAAGGPR